MLVMKKKNHIKMHLFCYLFYNENYLEFKDNHWLPAHAKEKGFLDQRDNALWWSSSKQWFSGRVFAQVFTGGEEVIVPCNHHLASKAGTPLLHHGVFGMSIKMELRKKHLVSVTVERNLFDCLEGREEEIQFILEGLMAYFFFVVVNCLCFFSGN